MFEGSRHRESTLRHSVCALMKRPDAQRCEMRNQVEMASAVACDGSEHVRIAAWRACARATWHLRLRQSGRDDDSVWFSSEGTRSGSVPYGTDGKQRSGGSAAGYLRTGLVLRCTYVLVRRCDQMGDSVVCISYPPLLHPYSALFCCYKPHHREAMLKKAHRSLDRHMSAL